VRNLNVRNQIRAAGLAQQKRPMNRVYRTLFLILALSTLNFTAVHSAHGQNPPGSSTSTSQAQATAQQAQPSPAVPLSPVRDALSRNPWNYGVFFNGGVGVGGDRDDYHFLSAGLRAGKVLTHLAGPRLLKGQFEYSAELMPWWQGFAPPFERYLLTNPSGPTTALSMQEPLVEGPFRTGGTYNGASITPIILRWDLAGSRRVLPFVQGAGGLIWTNHKFPPVGPLPQPGHQGTSVWNFSPQFGVGFHYFLKPNRSITFNANAVHISNASLGDANPGINSSVQFQIGYTWWK
jgi:lipid A 3-O-deacylase